MITTFKQGLVSLLNAVGLMKFIDKGLFQYSRFINRKGNTRFKEDNPSLILPPDRLIYDSFQINYKNYYSDSVKSAEGIINLAKPNVNINYASVLDFGCGLGRIIQHFPKYLPRAKLFGCDVNQEVIDWCKSNIEGVEFYKNELSPPLKFKNFQLNYIYAISVFTHLSSEMHDQWIQELYRVMAKGGVLMLTTQGNSYRNSMTIKEKRLFDGGTLVTRRNAEEGRSSYLTFHPEECFSELVNDFELVAFKAGDVNTLKPQQDVWLLRKR